MQGDSLIFIPIVFSDFIIWGDMMAEEAINNNSSVQEQWGQICSQLKVEVGETAFDSWLKPLTPGAFNDGIMNICVPTRFMRNPQNLGEKESGY